jgi:hypothetical protein
VGKLFVDPEITLDGQDITDWCHNIDMPFEAERVEVTGFRAQFRNYLAGRKDGVVTLGVYQDFDAGAIDDLFWPLFESGEEFVIVVRPEEEPTARYTLTCVCTAYNPLAGEQGEAADITITLPLSGATPITRERVATDSG